ncbi:probable LRR receptor-like serine/threonine-protein kinase RKF3 isoform X2 [Prosopis cineraria]|uniref:probable LRR receptor-like serine/threonine-protein kinase RKF3 isoform X2 n=1 Tax=Prosopis cineraria TaxID=364024 RepID=UPI00240FE213|nr:probable LRR receptor-like serine/threonine-protein kinase RKF3 isoform X2 [Prosopis cineraria]
MSLSFLIVVLLAFSRPYLSANNGPCPLKFTILRDVTGWLRLPRDPATHCQHVRNALHLVQSDYLRRSGDFFLPALDSSESCWHDFHSYTHQFDSNFDIRFSCGFQSSWISQGCMNITTRQQFETLSKLSASYLSGPSIGNVSTCRDYSSIYAAAIVNQYGPTDSGTAKCLFSMDLEPASSNRRVERIVIALASVVCVLGLLFVIGGFWLCRRGLKKNKIMRKHNISRIKTGLDSGLNSLNESTTLIRFTFDDIKKATRNFNPGNVIGRGGYGNVYNGVLPDGSEVALKRFKNCSAAGDASFAHEVEVIASVRHVNLVALRGFCTATTNLEGHQRIIVCELMKNGSLHDHLFGSMCKKLSWPTRQKIALGTARGLTYLHYGAQPVIIHRDIKASNILLDEKFEAKVADFGLAKFYPEGMTHMSTRIAGTMGYVAPEYALYGQLTERSDVFSYGVVLLELLSGKKGLEMNHDGQPSALSDWAWSLVRTGRPLDVIEDGMPETGAPHVMEKYVLVAVVCSHPQLYARPTMDQVVKMLESDESVPAIPERPLPLVARRSDIERSISNCGSVQLYSPTGYQSYAFDGDRHSSFNSN